jgi:hypothetical protein
MKNALLVMAQQIRTAARSTDVLREIGLLGSWLSPLFLTALNESFWYRFMVHTKRAIAWRVASKGLLPSHMLPVLF